MTSDHGVLHDGIVHVPFDPDHLAIVANRDLEDMSSRDVAALRVAARAMATIITTGRVVLAGNGLVLRAAEYHDLADLAPLEALRSDLNLPIERTVDGG